MAKSGNYYFESFERMVNISCQAAVHLQSALQNFEPGDLDASILDLHEIEHQGDEEKHEMMQKLAKEFVPPIEREDIVQLANEIDNVTDTIEDVLMRIYMYNIQVMRQEALDFADVIVQCCEALLKAIKELPHFHKSKTMSQALIDINTLEEQGDALYIRAMRKLYRGEKDVLTILTWSETFDRLEECCDVCEHVAVVLESVIMNNS